MSAATARPVVSGMSLVRRLSASYALLVLLIVLTGLSGVMALTAALRSTDQLVTQVGPTGDASAELLLSMTEMQSGVRGYLLTGDEDFLALTRVARGRLAARSNRLELLAADAGYATGVRRELRLAWDWTRRYVDPVLELSRQPGGLELIRRTRDNQESRRHFERFRAAAYRVGSLRDEQAVWLAAEATRVRRDAVVLLGIFVALAAAGGSLAAVRTARATVRPLSRLRRTVEAVTAGGLGERADVRAGPSEVRAVARAFNALTDERERAQAADEDRTRARRVAHDIGVRIRDSFAVDDMTLLERVAVEEVGTAFGADRVLLRRLRDGVLGPVTMEWREVDLAPLRPDQLAALAATGSAVQAVALWGDVAALTGCAGPEGGRPADPQVAEILEVTEAQSVLVVAFGAGQEPLGTLTVLQRGPRTWAPAEIDAVESVAAELGRALRHADLYAQERSLVDQLRELDRTKTDFLSTVSHELRTPLASIVGYTELLRDEADLDPASSRMLDVIERNSYRLNSLIEDLLTLSRIESGVAQTHRVPVDVASLVHNACADVAPRASDAGIALAVGEGPSVKVTGDPGQLDRVLLNLLTNAVKFTPEGGSVAVDWSVQDAQLHLSITDTGIGIPVEEQHRLASRFFRASNAMDAAIPGTGLGLTIVRGVLDRHGGELGIHSDGSGTRVVVRLPVAETLPTATAPAEHAHPEPAHAPHHGTGLEPARL